MHNIQNAFSLVCFGHLSCLAPQSDHLGGVYKREVPVVQEVTGFHLMPPETQNAPRRTSVQSTSQHLTDRPRVTWSQSDLTPLDLQVSSKVMF